MYMIENQYFIGGGRIQNVEWLRAFAVISLVFWHSICVYTGWQDYLLNVTDAVGHSIYTKAYSIFAKIFLPDANMPLFTMISGFVYSFLQKYKGKYRNTADFIKSKVNRLLVPYFIIGTLVVFTIADWNPISIILGDAHHLWFCAMLFWCFVGIRLYELLPMWLKTTLIAVCITSGFVFYGYDILYIYRTLHYFPYFLMGVYIVDYLPKIQEKPATILLIVFLTVVMLLVSLLRIKYFSNLTYLAYTYLFPILLFSIVPIHKKLNKLITLISKYSFGIYVFHEWLLWNMAHIDFIQTFAIKQQILYPLFAFVGVFLISTLLTHFSLKTKIGKYLLT